MTASVDKAIKQKRLLNIKPRLLCVFECVLSIVFMLRFSSNPSINLTQTMSFYIVHSTYALAQSHTVSKLRFVTEKKMSIS